MNIKDLSKPLTVDQIDFRIQSINKGGYATILAYKDARVDIKRLNEVCTPLGWKREHKNNNHNCIVSIWDNANKQWVSKEDTGTESYTEKEKGLASDSFKRSCFNWGIGLELYDYPIIQVKLNKDEFSVDGNKVKQTYKLKLKSWKWHLVSADDGRVLILSCKDEKGALRFEYDVEKTNEEQPIVYTLTKKDVAKWNGVIYGNSVYVDGEKKRISEKQLNDLKALDKYKPNK